MGRYLKYPVFFSFMLLLIFQCGCLNTDRDNTDDPAAGSYMQSGIQVALDSETLTSGCICSMGNALAGATITKEFTIYNTGEGVLLLTGSPRVTLSGENADLFQVTLQPGSIVQPGSSTTFTVRFTPDSEGLKSVTMSIPSDDADIAGYIITVEGYCGIKAPVSTSSTVSGLNSLTWDGEALHVLYYASGNLYYVNSSDNGSTWSVPACVATGTSRFPSMACNTVSNEVYISYHKTSDDNLYFRKRSSAGTWQSPDCFWSLDSASDLIYGITGGLDEFGYYSAITCCSDNNEIYIASYMKNTNWADGKTYTCLGLKSCTTYWTGYIVDSSSNETHNIGLYPSICCDSSRVYVAWDTRVESIFDYSYLFFSSGYSSWDDNEFYLDASSSDLNYGRSNAIACDDTNVYLAYYAGNNNLGFRSAPKSGCGDSNNWSDTVTIAGNLDYGAGVDSATGVNTAIAVDSGTIYVTYTLPDAVMFRRSDNSGSTWQDPVIIDNITGISVGDTSIAVNGTYVYVCYNRNGTLWFACSSDSGDTWQ